MISFKDFFQEEFMILEDYTPKKTKIAYKLFKVDSTKPGQLFPLYVSSKTPVPVGKWVDAKIGDTEEIKGVEQVKSDLGPLAKRPGWHSTDKPVSHHIGYGGVKPKYRGFRQKYKNKKITQVWAEILIGNDVEWQTVANSLATKLKNDSKYSSGPKKGQVRAKKGVFITKTAQLTDEIPKGGFYRYKTNTNMKGYWYIHGNMKVVKVLSQDDVERINSGGLQDLPRPEPLNLKDYGF